MMGLVWVTGLIVCNDNYSSHSVPIKIPCGTGLPMCCVSLSFPLSLTLWARLVAPFLFRPWHSLALAVELQDEGVMH